MSPFIRNHPLCSLECMSGSQENDPKADARYKVEAVKRKLRALAVGSWLVTTAPHVIDNG